MDKLEAPDFSLIVFNSLLFLILRKNIFILPGVLELLTGFFNFYAQLDFDSVILCPRTGRTLPRDVTTYQLPPELRALPPFMGRGDGLLTNTPVCLQDPFELTFNVCRNLTAKAVRSFTAVMGAAAEVCRTLQAQPAARPPGRTNIAQIGGEEWCQWRVKG
jgi:hypothetical protein